MIKNLRQVYNISVYHVMDGLLSWGCCYAMEVTFAYSKISLKYM